MLNSLPIALTLAAAQAEAPPMATRIARITTDECVSVHLHEEPWSECGVQAVATNADLSRILTVGSAGVIQLWDGSGREIRRIDWPDQPGGAHGFPDGRALIVGTTGIAVNHSNQLLLIDIADGRTLVQRTVAEAMTLDEFRVAGDRVFVQMSDRGWQRRTRELGLADGSLADAPGVDFMRFGQGYWVAGGAAPFTVHRADGTSFASPRPCQPHDARFCTSRLPDERSLHVLDVRSGAWRSFDLGRDTDGATIVHPAAAGERMFALVCSRAIAGGQPCAVRDLEAGRDVHAFVAFVLRASGALDEQGRPEVRVEMRPPSGGPAELRSIAADGSFRTVTLQERRSLEVPGGRRLVAAGERESLLRDRDGAPVARFPFSYAACGIHWLTELASCRVTPDGSRWLVPLSEPLEGEEEGGRSVLLVYAVPPLR
ncbi:MAG TPA: hypothetical protein VEW25_13630 [Allosphingosinicella sp.]|nr:hypothetical protein [Allosphingosinicella sp.]